ncbi:iron-containing alcohol dehydrogenase, partial [Microcoleus anatoxicus PTRS2]
FSQNKYPNSTWRYAQIANYLNLGGETDEEKVEKLIEAVEDLKHQVEIPATIQEVLLEQGVADDFFLAHVEEMADRAFDDQCTGANPRYPLIADLKQLLIQAYLGEGLTH